MLTLKKLLGEWQIKQLRISLTSQTVTKSANEEAIVFNEETIICSEMGRKVADFLKGESDGPG